ncbi:MAG: hypothetical protein MSC31_07655 [Solirubrobacteraceae bacterium MAG38_C4-C5]|nr:hypothetical protein [Candidatus Siliceabacter maunaloa]
MSDDGFTNVQSHEGRSTGVKLLVEFPPQEAERLTRLADEAGLSLGDYVRRLVSEAAAVRSR